MKAPKHHSCRQHWLWETLAGIRVYRTEGRRRIYNVRCAVCKRHAEVNRSGREVKL